MQQRRQKSGLVVSKSHLKSRMNTFSCNNTDYYFLNIRNTHLTYSLIGAGKVYASLVRRQDENLAYLFLIDPPGVGNPVANRRQKGNRSISHFQPNKNEPRLWDHEKGALGLTIP